MMRIHESYVNTANCAQRSGQMTLQIMVFGTVGTIMVAAFALWADVNIRAAYRSLNKAVAFAAAEAGIEYYRWHLAHAPTDYYDGQGATSTGPYVHGYFDKNGVSLGSFELMITPPPSGSSVVTIQSTGKVNADATIQKIIRVQLAKPSFAKYAVVANGTMRFGSGTETFGPIHSNAGIRFDGLAHNVITSAVASYDDPDHSGGNEFGVHTHVAPIDPLPPAAVPSRPDVFQAGRQFPVAPVDFTGITQDLSQMRTDAQAAGYYATGSAARGYELIFNTNDTFTLRRVTATTTIPGGCGSDPWTISTSTLVGTFPLPGNGLIFIEDNAWIRGQINTARVTVGSGRFPDNPSTRTSITFASSSLYTNYDGQDALSYIAQNNINIALKSENVIRVDGAMIAQNGRVGRFYYNSNCGTGYIRQQITSYGMIGTNQRYGFAYTDGTGYQIRILIYDSNLLYAPPPSFPLTTDEYEQISWDEVQ